MYLEDYRKARQLGQKEAKLCQSRGGSPYLPVLDDILSAEETCGEVSLGLVDIPLGRIFAVILYVAMIFAGVSSLQNMFEAVGESLLHKFPKLSRKAMLILLCVVCLGIGLHMEPIFKWGPWMDIVSIYIIPIGATLGAVSWFWIIPKKDLMDEVGRGAKKKPGELWYSLGRYGYVPCAVLLCAVALLLKVAF